MRKLGYCVMPYVLMIIGLFLMFVPDEAGAIRFLIQAGIGLTFFSFGLYKLNQLNKGI